MKITNAVQKQKTYFPTPREAMPHTEAKEI